MTATFLLFIIKQNCSGKFDVLNQAQENVFHLISKHLATKVEERAFFTNFKIRFPNHSHGHGFNYINCQINEFENDR